MISHGQSQLQPRKQELFRTESPLPDEFFLRLRGMTRGNGERRLAAAVLEDAVRCFHQYRGAKEFHRRLLYWEAERWFASRDPAPLFSFENVSSILGLNSDEIRKRLLRWTERRLDGLIAPFLEITTPQTRRRRLQVVPGASLQDFREGSISCQRRSSPPNHEESSAGTGIAVTQDPSA